MGNYILPLTIINGQFNDQFLIHPYQGGAGTTTNMNVNEVICNRALERLGHEKGDYKIVHPIKHVNCSQSTNDTYPTALRIACLKQISELSDSFAELQESLQHKEEEFSDILKLGRTQLMDALPMMVGQGFGAYSKAISRDRWRLYKTEERLREINIGGTAIGTGLNADKKYIYLVTEILSDLTGLGLARSDYVMDNTQNQDVFVEVSGLLKSAATNIYKISSDIRLLSSGPEGGLGEISLPKVQIGSSIMPEKYNPVIPEMLGIISIKVMANDQSVTIASMNGQLELNAFIPLIADSILNSIELLTEGVKIFRERCIKDIKVNKERCKKNLDDSKVVACALLHYIGYEKTAEIIKMSKDNSKDIIDTVEKKTALEKEDIEYILNPLQITKPGIPGK